MNSGVPVLVIDDDPAVTDLVKDMLQSAGYSVAVAHNPFVGLRLAREVKPSAVLCDMLMPDMTGADVLNVLASDPTTAEIARVIMTGHVDADRSNADAFLLKPFQSNELLQVLQRLESRTKLMPGIRVRREAVGPQTRVRNFTSSLN